MIREMEIRYGNGARRVAVEVRKVTRYPKLSDADVVRIRRLLDEGVKASLLAEIWDVSSATVSKIKSGERGKR